MAEEIRLQDSRAARWVAGDALRELRARRETGAGARIKA